MGPAKYQSPPKSYTTRLRQVSVVTPPLSRSNHREKSQRKAEKELCCLAEFEEAKRSILNTLKSDLNLFVWQSNITAKLVFHWFKYFGALIFNISALSFLIFWRLHFDTWTLTLLNKQKLVPSNSAKWHVTCKKQN